MSTTILIALTASIIMSAGRNILSKSISNFAFGTHSFFRMQAMIFFCGFVTLAVPALIKPCGLSLQTAAYSLIYALLLITAQWSYTAALSCGNTSTCVTVYSLGFVYPTVIGSIFWQEGFSGKNIVGLAAAILAVIVSGKSEKDFKSERVQIKSILPLIVAMSASGGLGIMQKIQQSSSVSDQKTIFIMLAFLFAGVISLMAEFFVDGNMEHMASFDRKKILCALGAGICFGCCNLLNTFLAGHLNSAFFFPVQNIGTILVSLLISIIAFSERMKKRDYAVLFLGICAIFLLKG